MSGGTPVPPVLFHPDFNRRLRHLTWSAWPFQMEGARGLATGVAYRRWGLSPRPENVRIL